MGEEGLRNHANERGKDHLKLTEPPPEKKKVFRVFR